MSTRQSSRRSSRQAFRQASRRSSKWSNRERAEILGVPRILVPSTVSDTREVFVKDLVDWLAVVAVLLFDCFLVSKEICWILRTVHMAYQKIPGMTLSGRKETFADVTYVNLDFGSVSQQL